MTIQSNTAGIFLIDARLLSSTHYLSQINQLLLKFSAHHPQAFLSLILVNEQKHHVLFFERSPQIPRLMPMTASPQAALFDAIIQTIQEAEMLLAVYDIAAIHMIICAKAQDRLSHHAIWDARQLIEHQQQKGWRFYFPFASFASLDTKSIAI